MKVAGCELCEHTEAAAWSLVFADARLRVVRVLDAPEFPAFYRVIWNSHVAELSDLAVADRAHLMNAVVAVERVLREALQPTKINLAALGNLVDRKSTRLNSSHNSESRMPSSA
jgi:diadenosine tetraphosphate (Ap4A) HIT family hydrolase